MMMTEGRGSEEINWCQIFADPDSRFGKNADTEFRYRHPIPSSKNDPKINLQALTTGVR
jgi:hypothetical protein